MTNETQDSAAVIEANRVLSEGATVDELRSALNGIRDELRNLEQSPHTDPAEALSMSQRRELEQEQERRSAENYILSRLFRLLGDAMNSRKAEDAIAAADENRAALDKALAAAQEARDKADKAAADALAQAEVIKAGRTAAGSAGARKVGATANQLDHLMMLLPDDLMAPPERKRLRLHTELSESKDKAG